MIARFCVACSLPICIVPAVAADVVELPTINSPDGQLRVTSQLDDKGQATFVITRRDAPLIKGRLGLAFAESGLLAENLKLNGTSRESRDQTYAIPVGKASSARDRHQELTVSLQERAKPYRKLDISLRVFDDGVAFRYQIPKQDSLARFVLTDEHSVLTFFGDPLARILPLNSYTTSYENYYATAAVSEIGSKSLIGLPILIEHPTESKSVWIALTEANLTDYSGMYVSAVDGAPGTFTAKLSPLPGRNDGAKVVGETPFASPWRVLMIADDPGRLIESNIVFHLNEPSRIEDTSWIRPGKTTFPWWNHYVLEGVDFQPGVNTATMKHYIDFCAEQGIPYHTLDGLDIAWYGGPIDPQGPTDVTTATPSIDMPELLRYAHEKGVRLRLWLHWKALKPQLDQALATYERWGIEGVMIDFMDRDDQEMVRWYHEVAEKAARHRLTVTWHGAYKPTGMERTWPNVLSYEGVLNQEYNKWSATGTPPEHNINAAFIRMLAGPLDYHQGGMRSVLPEFYRSRDVAPPVQGTRGHQLAMYIVYQNHLPMMVDHPAAYRNQPGIDFLVNLPATWDETRVVHAEMGKCVVIARRHAADWYLGGMTADESRKLELPMQFIGNGSFDVALYLDDHAGGPTSLTCHEQTVSSTDSLPIVIPAAGGFVAKIAKHSQ
jgi:alpha-glucosidase